MSPVPPPNRWLAAIAAAAAAVAGVFAMPSAVWAHGGEGHENTTSNYRTRITNVTPEVEGLEVAIVDIDGTVRVTYRGSGELLVLGYEDEPYLRIGPDGTAVNTVSPAGYLNRDRFANSEVPDAADAAAVPAWERIDGSDSVEWHDHRNHWMSPTPPPETEAAPDEMFVIKTRWEIPLVVDGRAVVVAGDLVWLPPPSPLVSLAVAGLVGAVLGGLLWTRRWRLVAVGAAAVGAAALTIDVAGTAAASADSMSNRIWMFLWPLAAAVAVWRLGAAALRRVEFPTLALGCVGLVLVMIGGVSRRGVLTRSQVFSDLDPDVVRWCVAIALAVGLALTVRFIVFLAALLIDRDHPAARPPGAPTAVEVAL